MHDIFYFQTRWPIGVIGGSSVMAGKNVVIDPFTVVAADDDGGSCCCCNVDDCCPCGIILRNGGSGGIRPPPPPLLIWPFDEDITVVDGGKAFDDCVKKWKEIKKH